MLAIANQQLGALTRYGVTREEADRAAWTVDAAGRRLQGAAAVNRVLEELGAGSRTVAKLYRVPPLAAAEEATYRWFAPRRGKFQRFGVSPECSEPGSGCA